MAKSVTKIREREMQEERKEAKLQRIESLFADHTDELEQTMRLLTLMHEKGVLDIGVALLEQGHDLLEIVVDQANRPGSIGGIKSLIAIVQSVTKMDANLVSAVFNGLSDASQVISGGGADDIADLWDLVRVMRDPDVNAGLAAVFAVLKTVGQHIEGSEDTGSARSFGDAAGQRRKPVAT